MSDQVWIFRQGRVVGGRRTTNTSGRELVDLITGVKHANVVRVEERID